MEQQEEYKHCSKNAGLIEEEQKLLARDMTTAAISVLSQHGIMVSDKERTLLQHRMSMHVQESTEIEASIVYKMENEYRHKSIGYNGKEAA